MSDANDSTEQLPVHNAKAAFGGAVCCSVTHSGTTPVDVFKTQVQLKPAKYISFFSADVNTVSDVSGASATGGTPTSLAMGMNKQDARKNRDFNTLGGSAVVEFVADVFLCPFEACRTRSVSDPSYAKGILASGQKFVAENVGTSSPTSRMNKMLRSALRRMELKLKLELNTQYPRCQWNNGCKGRWIHRAMTTTMWREVWRRTTWRILPIRRLSGHACFEFLLFLSACVTTDNARCVLKWMLSNTIVTRDCEGPAFVVVFLPDPCFACPRTLSVPP